MIKIAFVISLALMMSGCNTLTDVRDELGKGGFALWYPAEGGVQVGQIWQTKGKERRWVERKPTMLESYTNPSQFERLKKTVDANISLDAKFSKGILGKAGELSVALKAGTVKNVDLDFGDTQIERLVLGDLKDSSLLKQYPKGYVSDLHKVMNGDNNYFVVAAVVKSAGMKYKFTCDDTAQLEAQAPAIFKAINVEGKINIISKTEATLDIPSTTPLVIGMMPVSGKDLDLPPSEMTDKVATKIQLMNLKSSQMFLDLQ